LILSGDLGTFVRESTDKELFTYFKSAGNVTYWERSDFPVKYSLDELLHERNIPFRCGQAMFGARRLSIDRLCQEPFLQSLWLHCHQLKWGYIENVAHLKDIGKRGGALLV